MAKKYRASSAPSSHWWAQGPAVEGPERVNRVRTHLEAASAFGPQIDGMGRTRPNRAVPTPKRVQCPACPAQVGLDSTGDVRAHRAPAGHRCFGVATVTTP